MVEANENEMKKSCYSSSEVSEKEKKRKQPKMFLKTARDFSGCVSARLGGIWGFLVGPGLCKLLWLRLCSITRVYLLTPPPPKLVYRTGKAPWIKPTGPEAYRELKMLRGVFDPTHHRARRSLPCQHCRHRSVRVYHLPKTMRSFNSTRRNLRRPLS
jgi:hypothetical protein